MRPVPQVGERLPFIVKPDDMRNDPPPVRPVTLSEVVRVVSTAGFPDNMRRPLWIELTDGERTIRAQVSSFRGEDDKIFVGAEVEQP